MRVKQLLKELEQRLDLLRSIQKDKEKAATAVSSATLLGIKSGKYYQYYEITEDKKRKYLSKKEKEKIRTLVQEEYDQRVYHRASEEEKILAKLVKFYRKGSMEDIYKRTGEPKRPWIEAVELPDQLFVQHWRPEEFKRKEFQKDAPDFYSEKGEHVRSKSEILIANTLYHLQIPYRYEYPLELNGAGLIHPDFTVLNLRLRKTYFWEHLGMMDDPEYAERAIQRIQMYEENGIFPGTELILTYETSRKPMGTRQIERVVRHYLY